MKRHNTRTAISLAVALSAATGSAQDTDPYAIEPGRVISYTRDVQPIFEEKCIACHACFDAPAQLNFTNAFGVQRGAIKLDPYAPRWHALTPFRFENTAMSIEDFRELGFFSVLEGGKDSLMGKMVKLGYEHQWKPNERIPKNIEIDSILHRLFAPTLKEFPGYAAAYPRQGMPFAIAGLDANEYTLIMNWLEQGAKFDEKKPVATAAESTEIAVWEKLLNMDDKRHRLVARYIYEHLCPLHFHFGDSQEEYPNFFMMVRSKTPPGKPIDMIETPRFTSGIEGEFFYRFAPVDVILHHKRHIPLNLAGKLERWTEMFFGGEEWAVDQLPGYSEREQFAPLRTYEAIPPKSRYAFLLDNNLVIERAIQQGASCRTGLIVSTTAEQVWHAYEDPETSLYVNDAKYRKALNDATGPDLTYDDFLKVVLKMKAYHETNIGYRTELANTERTRTKITDIWNGTHPGDTPALTAWRHDDTAGTKVGYSGDYPQRLNLQDLAIFEHRLYCAYPNFDLFEEMSLFVPRRADHGFWLLAMEVNFLRFLPDETRLAVIKDLYQGPAAKELLAGGLPLPYEIEFPPEMDFKTDDPKKEFFDRLIAHMGDAAPTADPIARPKPASKPNPVTEAMQLIDEKGDTDGKFKLYLPEATFIRVDSKGGEQDVYTLTLDWHVSSTMSLAALLTRMEPMKDRVSVVPGIVTSYPNFMFRVDEEKVSEFAEALTSVETEEDYLAVVDRWGVRRTNEKFWDILHSITEIERKQSPRHAAIFDVNRYRDP